MIIFFAGSDTANSHNKKLIKAGVKNRLESYYVLKNSPIFQGYDKILLDSGGFTARMLNVQISVEEYAKYINKYDIKLAFNLDTNDVPETISNQKYLEKNTNSYIIPIYHLSDYLEDRGLLQRFVADGYNYIGIGGVAGERSLTRYQEPFYNYIFHTVRDKVKTHGLGITGRRALEKYPWYSVDSTSWLGSERFGTTQTIKDKRIHKVQAKTLHYTERSIREAKHFLKLEKQITELWEKRGVHWD